MLLTAADWYNRGVRLLLFAAVVVAALLTCRSLCAQGAAATPKEADGAARLNFAWRTLGGEQFWSDELVYGQWRVQRHALSGHYRLLDPANVRRAWGADQQCRAALDEQKRLQAIPLLDGRAVITLHG